MLTEMVDYSHKIEEKLKAMQSEVKENVQGTNSEGKETTTQITDLKQKEEINIQPEQNEETKIQKKRRGLGTSGTTLNIPTPKSQGCQKEKRKSKELKTYNEGELPNLAKEIDFQDVQEAQSPKKVGPKEAYTKAHHNYIIQD